MSKYLKLPIEILEERYKAKLIWHEYMLSLPKGYEKKEKEENLDYLNMMRIAINILKEKEVALAKGRCFYFQYL